MSTIKIKDIKIFTFIWIAIFATIFFYQLVKYNNFIPIVLVIIISLILTVLFKPVLLSKPYTLWIKFGEFIGNIMSKIIMSVLYFGLFTPVSILLKIFGKDLLRKKMDKKESTYWISRETQPQSMKNQF
ncbi:SxtJ family membrane protein [Sulfurimonas sp.]|uniref:SxtJ family membrane protein n=1 Tax=Sulfurimonas sp. TaxID=2022749 RepID=UPI003561DD43